MGKTTVAAALSLALARTGRDTIAAELSGQARIPALLGHPSPGPPGEELEVAPGLWATTIDPEGALVQWAGRLVRPRPLLEVAVRSRAFSGFVSAAPGAAELISVTKAVELTSAQRWVDGSARHDVAILDAPASGHGVGLLRTAGTYAEIARVGPVASQAREVDELIRDPERCLLVTVALPEETPVNETLELEAELERRLGRGPSLTVMNGMLDEGLSEEELGEARSRLAGGAPLAAAQARRTLAARQAAQLERLRAGCGAPLAVLPRLEPSGSPAEGVERLSALLEPSLAAG